MKRLRPLYSDRCLISVTSVVPATIGHGKRRRPARYCEWYQALMQPE